MTEIITRRQALVGAISFLAAPAIVRASVWIISRVRYRSMGGGALVTVIRTMLAKCFVLCKKFVPRVGVGRNCQQKFFEYLSR